MFLISIMAISRIYPVALSGGKAKIQVDISVVVTGLKMRDEYFQKTCKWQRSSLGNAILVGSFSSLADLKNLLICRPRWAPLRRHWNLELHFDRVAGMKIT